MKQILLTYIALGSMAHAQSWLYPESIVHYNPLRMETRWEETRFLSAIQFWGEFGQYVIERDENHRWDITIGGTVEMWGGKDWNILFETNAHLLADPNNNIAFNPRAFVWEEGFLYGLRSGQTLWQFGYQHRCKHDVDNLELLKTTGREEERALIFGSVMARWERLPVTFGGVRLRPFAESHLYVITQDQRFPVSSRALRPSVKSILAALRARADVYVPIAETIELGLTADMRASAYGADPEKRFKRFDRVEIEPAAELFLVLKGSQGHMHLYARYAYQPDDFISPIPRSASLLAAGVRLVDGR